MAMKLRCVATFVLALAACGPNASPSPSPATAATTTAAASTSANATSPDPITTSPPPDSPPPSGFYRYALHVVSDDCTPALASFEQNGMMVFAHTTSKGVVLNVPLVVKSGS